MAFQPLLLAQIVQNHLDLRVGTGSADDRAQIAHDVAEQRAFLRVGRRGVDGQPLVAHFVFRHQRCLDALQDDPCGLQAARADDPMRLSKIVLRKPAPGWRAA
jgi:hypothetical protein